MKISFCIPTYNRKEYLEQLIKSIAEQKKHSFEVEICISDNASTDHTGDKISEWEDIYGVKIIYHCNAYNVGPDKNFLLAVSLGTGDYCWIFGSDDLLDENALSTLSEYIVSDANIYLCDRVEMSSDMSSVRDPHRRWLSCGSRCFELNSSEDRLKYFNFCQSIGGVFSYLSSIVVKRSSWLDIEFDDSYNGSAYAHVYILFCIFNSSKNKKVHYISEPLVLCRGDNDTFESNGRGKRINIDFNGYLKLADDFYGNNSLLRKALQKVILRERPWLYTTMAMAVYGDLEDKKKLSKYYNALGYPNVITDIIFLLKYPIYTFNKSRLVKRVIKKIMRK